MGLVAAVAGQAKIPEAHRHPHPGPFWPPERKFDARLAPACSASSQEILTNVARHSARPPRDIELR